MLVQVGRLVGHVRPSCPCWLLLGSNLVLLRSNLAQLSANLAQLGPILAQLGSNLVQFWSQLVPTWPQNLTKMSFKMCFLASPSDLQFSIDFWPHVGSIFQGFCKAAMSQNYKKPIVFLRFLATSHLVHAHHFVIDFGCQHEAQNPSKIQLFRAMLGSLDPSLMILAVSYTHLTLPTTLTV